MTNYFKPSDIYSDFDNFKSRINGYVDLDDLKLSDTALKIAYHVLKTTFWRRDIAYSDIADFEGSLVSILNDIMGKYATRYNALSHAYNLPAVNFFGFESSVVSNVDNKTAFAQDGDLYKEPLNKWTDQQNATNSTVTTSGVNSMENDINSLERLIDNGWRDIKKDLAGLFRSCYGYYL